jgi:hypothetical protein
MNDLLIPEKIQKEVSTITDQAMAVRVVDVDTYALAGEMFVTGKEMIKNIEAFFKPIKQKMDAAKKEVLDKEKAELAKVQPGLDHLSKEMTAWNIEQERLRKIEEDRLRQEALKREEEERLQAAIQAEQEGSTDEAAAILEEPVYVPAPQVQSNVPKQAGLTMQTTWKHRVTNLQLLIKAVAEGRAPAMCVQADDQFLGAQARAGKGTITYPGVEFYPEQSMKGTGRR